MSLTKPDLVDKLTKQVGLSQKECLSALEATFNLIKAELENGNDVKISGFGSWIVKHKKERKGKNPKTGEPITISERKVVTFKTSELLKRKLNN